MVVDHIVVVHRVAAVHKADVVYLVVGYLLVDRAVDYIAVVHKFVDYIVVVHKVAVYIVVVHKLVDYIAIVVVHKAEDYIVVVHMVVGYIVVDHMVVGHIVIAGHNVVGYIDFDKKLDYKLVSMNGPEHNRVYECIARLNGETMASGTGPTKKMVL